MLSYSIIFCWFNEMFCSSKGLEKSWERHGKVADYFHAGLESMGLKLFVKEKVSLKYQYIHVISL